MSEYQIITADVMDWLTEYDGPMFHASFSDWPYNLESIRKRFGSKDAAPAKHGTDGAFQRQSKGFMGQTWDTDIAYNPEVWNLIKDLLHSGAFTASFSHPRKQHRLATAQEDAGYLINPAIYNYGPRVPAQLGWIYGSGKQNGTRVDYQVDQAAGAEREKVKIKVNGSMMNFGGVNRKPWMDKASEQGYHEVDAKIPVTELAQIWEGWQYGSPLAPEIEPILIAQKPYEAKRTIEDITETGAGAMNIAYGRSHKVSDRFPGNLVLSHHPECRRVGKKQVRNPNGRVSSDQQAPKTKNVYGDYHHNNDYTPNDPESIPDYECHPDCQIKAKLGDKARYFYQADWSYEVAEALAAADPIFYAGKVQPKERNAGCEALPKKTRNRVNPGGLEKEARYAPTQQENNHPTLKPIKLAKWIAGLLLPPPEYAPRRIFVPCAGTGSEMIGALLAGWDEVIGVELRPKYAEIATARLEFWSEWLKRGQTDVDIILEAYKTEDPQQMQMGI